MRICASILPPLAASLLLVLPASLIAAPPAEHVEELHLESQTDKGPLKRSEVEIIKVTATVKSIDMENRVATVMLPGEKLIELKVSPEIKRLGEIKAGDQVVVKYVESLAFEVRPPTAAEKENPEQTEVAAGINTDALPPGMAAGLISQSVVEITNIDLENEMVEIKFPSGKTYSMKAKIPENLKRIKVGDTVAVTYAEAMAVEIEPLKKSS